MRPTPAPAWLAPSLLGAYVPGIDVTLSVGKIRGVESHGMMCPNASCSCRTSTTASSTCRPDAPVGTSLSPTPILADPMIEINLTPNRPDATVVLRHRPRSRGVRPGAMPKGGAVEAIKVKTARPRSKRFRVAPVRASRTASLNAVVPLAIGLRPSSRWSTSSTTSPSTAAAAVRLRRQKVVGNLVVRCREGDKVLLMGANMR